MSDLSRYSHSFDVNAESCQLDKAPDELRLKLKARLFETLELGEAGSEIEAVSTVDSVRSASTTAAATSAAKWIWAGTLCTAVGFGAGFAARGYLMDRPNEAPAVTTPAVTKQIPVELPVADPTTAPPPAAMKPSKRVAPPTVIAASKEERLLLEQARMALIQGRVGDAALALDTLEQRFPKSSLREERLVFQIQRYLLQKQPGYAEATLSTLRRDFPDSPMLPVMESAVQRQK